MSWARMSFCFFKEEIKEKTDKLPAISTSGLVAYQCVAFLVLTLNIKLLNKLFPLVLV